MSAPESPLPGSNSSSAEPPASHSGTKLGKYLLGKLLGTGGMGAVYEAQDTFLKRKVAVKVLPDSLSRDNDAVRRFVLEARAFARVNHPNAVLIYEVDRRHGICYLVMELMHGGSMQEFLQTHGPLPWPEATYAVADACRGLAATHAASLVHRDIKPGNLMRSADGGVKLADFGLAKDADSVHATLTLAGGIIGTPSYMSPEQCRSEPTDPRSDIYALGATYYALLTGRPPYAGELPVQVLFAHCSAPIPDPRAVVGDIPEACAAIVRRAMAKEPRDRYPTAKEMLADLEAALYAGARSMIGDAEAAPDATLADLAAAVQTQQPESVASVELNSMAESLNLMSGAVPLATARARTYYRAPSVTRRKMWTALIATVAALGIILPVGIQQRWGFLQMFGLTSETPPGPDPVEPPGSQPSAAPRSATTKRTTPTAAAPTTHTAPATQPPPREPSWVRGFGGNVTIEGQVLDMTGAVTAMTFSHDGMRFAAGHAFGSKVWEALSGKPIDRFAGNRAVKALGFSAAHTMLAIAGPAGVTIRDEDNLWERTPDGGDACGPARAVQFSPNGELLAAVTGADGAQIIRIWEMSSGRQVQTLDVPGGGFQSLSFSPSGRSLVAGGDHKVFLWATAGWKQLPSLPTSGAVTALEFAPDGHSLAVANPTCVEFWDPSASWAKKAKKWDQSGGTCLSYTSDSKILAVGTMDGSVHFWDVPTEKPRLRIVYAHIGPVHALAYMPGSHTLVTGGDKFLKVYEFAAAPKPAANPDPKPATRPADGSH